MAPFQRPLLSTAVLKSIKNVCLHLSIYGLFNSLKKCHNKLCGVSNTIHYGMQFMSPVIIKK